MPSIILSGCHGRMGRQLIRACSGSDIVIVAGIDHRNRPSDSFQVFSELIPDIPAGDVIVDFSHPRALTPLLEFCKFRGIPALLAVTGYSERQTNEIKAASKLIPIFQSPNLSIGANIMLMLTEYAASLLGPDFDFAIIERHHKNKLDSPSGTALALSEAIQRSVNVSSIRAGTTAGEHTVIFAGKDEILQLFHRADTRDVYAVGALRAVRFLSKINKPGLYGMRHLLIPS